jgi:hypothetical protein
MARQHGTPGRTLVQSILGLMLLPATVGLGAYLIFGAMSPALRFAAPLVGFFAVVMVLRSRSFERAFVAKARGAIGENAVGRALQRLPTGWRAFHDVRLDGENVDHVVVSNRGVFSIEVKNYSGKVKIGTAGIIAHGQRNDRIVLQAQRQAHRLRTLLGVDVQPLLVFVGRDVAVTAMGTLTVMGDSGWCPGCFAAPSERSTWRPVAACSRRSSPWSPDQHDPTLNPNEHPIDPRCRWMYARP